MKLISYNVNGLRAVIGKGFWEWLAQENPDMVCLQETKASVNQIDVFALRDLGYQHFWLSAQKKGYSGTAIFSKINPEKVIYGCGIPAYDLEGRCVRTDFKDFSLMSVYMPSGSSGEDRQAFKMQWLNDFLNYVTALKKEIPNLIIAGDFNICHKAIDIHNPTKQGHLSGFLPEERAWMDAFIASGFIDSFRFFNQNPEQYTWWSYRSGAKAKNLGWRIDYFMVSSNFTKHLKSATILPDITFSDHCPIVLEF